MRREKSILVSLPCVATYLIYDTDLPVFSFSGFHGDPNCQIECDMSVITKNWRYWKMINETNQRNYSGLIKRHTMHLLFLFQVVLFLCLLNWTPGRQRDWILFFLYRLCSCRHWGDNNLSVGLFDELSASSGHICVFLTADFLKATSDILEKWSEIFLHDFLLKWCTWCFFCEMTFNTTAV